MLNIGSDALAVNISPTKTKFYEIVPRNVSLNTIEAQLKAEKFSYEMIGVEFKDSEINPSPRR